jgi:hypothetical protein
MVRYAAYFILFVFLLLAGCPSPNVTVNPVQTVGNGTNSGGGAGNQQPTINPVTTPAPATPAPAAGQL